jgi:hypothetical protein
MAKTKTEWLRSRITIGGPVTDAQYREIILRAGAREERLENERLVLEEQLAAWGEFGMLESYLQVEGIPYDRASQSYAEQDAKLVRWRPGMTELATFSLTNDLSSLFLRLDVLQPLLTQWFRGDLTENSLVASINDALGAQIPPLPKFSILFPGMEAVEEEAPVELVPGPSALYDEDEDA